jgi:hypothetical protein
MKKDYWFHRTTMSSNLETATKDINISVNVIELTEEILNFYC